MINLIRQLDEIGVLSTDGVAFRASSVPIILATFDGLPEQLEALVVTSDLQSRILLEGGRLSDPPLAGAHAPRVIAEVIERELGLGCERTAVLLAGDLWCNPISMVKMGGYGDVRGVVDAFEDQFFGVVCVPGNHDLFTGSMVGMHDCRTWRADVQLLSSGIAELAGVRIGCVGGCVGNPTRAFRFTAEDQARRTLRVLREQPDWILTHEGPPGGHRDRGGGAQLAAMLARIDRPTPLFCGHEQWPNRIVAFGHVTAVNSAAAVIVLVRPTRFDERHE